MSAIFARTSASPAARSSSGVRFDDAFRSRALSAIAAFSSSDQTFLAGRFAGVFVSAMQGLLSGSWLGSRDSGRSGGGDRGGLALEDPDGVAERVAQAHVGPVEVLHRLLGEVRDSAGLEGLVQRARVVGVEDEAAQRALGDQLAELLGRRLVMERRARLLERDLDVRVARDADGEPA